MNKGEIEEIVKRIPDPDSTVIDDTFLEQCDGLISAMDQAQLGRGLKLTSHDDGVIVINEGHRDRANWQHRRRNDGSSYFDSHLLGTAREVVDTQMRSTAADVLIAVKHDNVEDRARLVRPAEPLMDWRRYIDQLHVYSEDDLRALERRVTNGVDGVSKVVGDAGKDRDATFLRMLRAMSEHGPDAPMTKGADATHNAMTIRGHGDSKRAKQEDIIGFTEMLYIPLMHLLKVWGTEEKLIEHCIAFWKPELYIMVP